MNYKKCRTKRDIKNDPRVNDFYRGSTHGLIFKWYAELKNGFWSSESETTSIRSNTIGELCFLLNEDVAVDPRPESER